MQNQSLLNKATLGWLRPVSIGVCLFMSMACGSSTEHTDKRVAVDSETVDFNDQQVPKRCKTKTKTSVGGQELTASFCNESSSLGFFDVDSYLEKLLQDLDIDRDSMVRRSRSQRSAREGLGNSTGISNLGDRTSIPNLGDIGRTGRLEGLPSLGNLSGSNSQASESSVQCTSQNGQSSCTDNSTGNCQRTISPDGTSIQVVCRNT